MSRPNLKLCRWNQLVFYRPSSSHNSASCYSSSSPICAGKLKHLNSDRSASLHVFIAVWLWTPLFCDDTSPTSDEIPPSRGRESLPVDAASYRKETGVFKDEFELLFFSSIYVLVLRRPSSSSLQQPSCDAVPPPPPPPAVVLQDSAYF